MHVRAPLICVVSAVFFAAICVNVLIPKVTLAAQTINWTFFGPGADGKIQGPFEAKYPDATGKTGVGNMHTLDDVRLGNSRYVTIASADVMKNRWYCIGTVTFTSPQLNGGDGNTHTLENVVGYVHDTGCAFNGSCSCKLLPQYCDHVIHPEKMDLPVGNFKGYSATAAFQYVVKNPNSAQKVWQQIAGLPAAGAASTANSPCGGEVQETGVPYAAQYRPSNPAAELGPGAQIYTPFQQGQNSAPYANPYMNGPQTNVPTGLGYPTQPAPSAIQPYSNLPQPTPVSNLITPSDAILATAKQQSISDVLALLSSTTSTSTASSSPLGSISIGTAVSVGCASGSSPCSSASISDTSKTDSASSKSTASVPGQSPSPTVGVNTFTTSDLGGITSDSNNNSSGLGFSVNFISQSILSEMKTILLKIMDILRQL